CSLSFCWLAEVTGSPPENKLLLIFTPPPFSCIIWLYLHLHILHPLPLHQFLARMTNENAKEEHRCLRLDADGEVVLGPCNDAVHRQFLGDAYLKLSTSPLATEQLLEALPPPVELL